MVNFIVIVKIVLKIDILIAGVRQNLYLKNIIFIEVAVDDVLKKNVLHKKINCLSLYVVIEEKHQKTENISQVETNLDRFVREVRFLTLLNHTASI